MAQDIVQIFLNAPPVTRVLVTAMFLESALVHGGLVSFEHFVFYSPWVFKFPPQLWRLCTAFLLTNGGFSFVIDLYFMWTYGSGLELSSPRFTQPGDFFTYVGFVSLVIATTAGYILQAPVFTSALMLAFIYTFAQDNRGQRAHFVIFQIPVEFLPWAMLMLTLVLGGLSATLQQGTGIIAAHLYDFLTRLYPTFQDGRNYLQTPAIINRLFGSEQTTVTNKGFGTAIRPGQPAQQQASTGSASGRSGGWGSRGQGRRLGGG